MIAGHFHYPNLLVRRYYRFLVRENQ
eukprot:SAG11_NODE_28484_length_321_cov_0.689189_1_plen_25_part_01